MKNGNNSKVKEKIKDKKSDSNNQYLNEIFYFLLSSSVLSNQLLLWFIGYFLEIGYNIPIANSYLTMKA